MTARFQVVVDCSNPERLATFWAEALGYKIEDPPAGFVSWDSYWRSVGVPEEELGQGDDSIVDPAGAGPRIWFQWVPESKVVKNRIHFDISVGGGRSNDMSTRRRLVEGEVQRLTGLGAVKIRALEQEGLEHYAVAMVDPEGNEFDVC